MKVVKALGNLILWMVLLIILLIGSIPGFFLALIFYSIQNGWLWGKLLLEKKLLMIPNPTYSNQNKEFYTKLAELQNQKKRENEND